jgi:hypothetical protein
MDEKAMNKAVKTLGTASKSKGILSDDDTFQDRLTRMGNHLNSIITIKTNEKQ